MKLTFHGAVRTVTGSQHLLEINNQRILLDCGLYQGRRKEAFELNRKGFCAGSEIDTLVLSHAHIDHSGNVPSLVKRGFKGNIYTTSATRDLCAVMLQDSGFIQERDVEYVNHKRKKLGKRLFEPLYTKQDAVSSMKHFIGLGYEKPKQIADGVILTFFDAGHMLGSAHVAIDFEERNTGKTGRLVFSGDIGRKDLPIIRDPVVPHDGADILIIESTYGNRKHPSGSDIESELQRIVNKTYKKRGSLIIPAFAVGRTQQIIFILNKLYKEDKIPPLPVYIDSPLAIRTTEVFHLHPETFDLEVLEFMEQGNSPFKFDALHLARSVEDSKRLNKMSDPAIIISASGMMEHGRILHHLKNRIGRPENTVLVTGWQAPYTLGRQIVNGEKTVKIFGEQYEVKASIESLTGLSGHADKDELVSWASDLKKKPASTFVVHGEVEASEALAGTLDRELGWNNLVVPELGQSFIL